MFFINDVRFEYDPGSCGTCGFFSSGATHLCPNPGKGLCRLFWENHHSYIAPPRRCQKLFRKAVKYPDGTRLVIVVKEND